MDEQIEFAAVTPERWEDLARLFERRGGPRYCWCMLWREMTGSPSHKFMGVQPTFLATGSEEIGRVGKRRHAMRRRLRPTDAWAGVAGCLVDAHAASSGPARAPRNRAREADLSSRG